MSILFGFKVLFKVLLVFILQPIQKNFNIDKMTKPLSYFSPFILSDVILGVILDV